jgi:hypothetical protein
MSDELKKFLADYLAWVDAGAPEGEPFTRHFGLCFNAEEIDHKLYKELCGILEKEFPDHAAYPFGGMSVYLNYNKNHTQHLNQKRIDWIKSKLE